MGVVAPGLLSLSGVEDAISASGVLWHAVLVRAGVCHIRRDGGIACQTGGRSPVFDSSERSRLGPDFLAPGFSEIFGILFDNRLS